MNWLILYTIFKPLVFLQTKEIFLNPVGAKYKAKGYIKAKRRHTNESATKIF